MEEEEEFEEEEFEEEEEEDLDDPDALAGREVTGINVGAGDEDEEAMDARIKMLEQELEGEAGREEGSINSLFPNVFQKFVENVFMPRFA